MSLPAYPVLLVVEDDLLVRLTLVDALTDSGFDVVEAVDAEEALDLLGHRGDIVALLTDISLPGGMDGFALAREARQMHPDLPVLYASGRFSAAEPARSVANARFLAKPFMPALAATVLWDLMQQGKSALAAAPQGAEATVSAPAVPAPDA